MLTIGPKNERSTTINGIEIKDYREISRIFSSNPKYNSADGEMSIYLIPDNYLLDILRNVDSAKQEVFGKSIVEESKSKSGRAGRKVKKMDIELLSEALDGNMPPEDLEEFLNHIAMTTKLGDQTSGRKPPTDTAHMKEVYKKAWKIKVNSRADISKYKELILDDLDWKDEKTGEIIPGELVPLPITNFSKEQIDDIFSGKTIFYIEQRLPSEHGRAASYNSIMKSNWKKCAVKGNFVEEIIKNGYNGERIYGVKPNEEKPLMKQTLSKESDQSTGEVSMEIEAEAPKFQKYVPCGDEMVEVSYIYGPNRSGKTFYCAKYAILWSEMFENWPIYVFSRRGADKVLDDIKAVERIAVDQNLVDNPLTMDDFEHSLVIFDDIDTIADLPIRKAIQKLRDDIIETGRQKLIYCVNTSHLGTNYKTTRAILNEANSYTLFPRKGNYGHNEKILKEKLGMKKDAVAQVINKEGVAYKGKWGWVTVYKDSPQYIIWETGVKLL